MSSSVKFYVRELIVNGDRGTQSALARHLGAATATVNKWKFGHSAPHVEYWRGIEEFFGLERGELSLLEVEGTPLADRLDQLQDLLNSFQEEIDRVRRASGLD